MTYTPPTRSQAGGLTDEDRAKLSNLERVKQPSGWQRGELRELRLRATSDGDQARTDALIQKWGTIT